MNPEPFLLKYVLNMGLGPTLEKERARKRRIRALAAADPKVTSPACPAVVKGIKLATISGAAQSKSKPETKSATWTAAQDAELQRLKAADGTRPWKDVAAALGKEVGDVKTRWGQIKPTTAGESEDVKGNKNGEKKEKPKGKSEEAKAKGKKNAQVRHMTLTEDEVFSYTDLQTISEILQRDRVETWLRVCSEFFDRTGKRVHPDDVADKFGGT